MNHKHNQLVTIFFSLLTLWLVSYNTGWSQIISKGFKVNGTAVSYHKVLSLDADNDGDIDILSFPEIYFNDGQGNMQYYQTLLEDNYDFEDIAIGDLDNNGYTDIVVLFENGKILIFANDSSGFNIKDQTQKLEYNPAKYAQLSLLDVNSDGILDLVFKGLISNSYVTYIGDSDLQYRFFRPFSRKFRNALAVVSADINNDDSHELLVPNNQYRRSRNQLYYYNLSDDNTYQLIDSVSIGTPYINHYKLYDIDGDGDRDLIYCAERGPRTIYCNLRNKKGGFDSYKTLFTSVTKEYSSIMDFVIGDFNTDNLPDFALIIEGRGNSPVQFIKQEKQGLFKIDNQSKLPRFTHYYTFIFDDFNGDGINDLAGYDTDLKDKRERFNIYLYTKGSTKTQVKNWFTDVRTTGFIFVDVNNDNRQDIVGYYQSEVFCSLMDSLGNYSPYFELASAPYKIMGLESAYIDNDHFHDLVISTDDRANGKVGWFRNIDGKSFGTYKNIHTGEGKVINFLPIQVPGKKESDIVINYWSKTNYSLYTYQNTKGIFRKNASPIVQNQKQYTYLTTFDVNNDQYDDLIDLGSKKWFKYTPIDGWVADSLRFTGSYYHGIYAAKVNNDHFVDLITPTFNNVKWVENQNNDNWKEHILIDKGSIEMVRIGDINGDSFDDIVCVSKSYVLAEPSYLSSDIGFTHKYTLCLFLNNGEGKFTLKTLHPIEKINELRLLDYDEDGDLDIMTCSHFWPNSGIKIWKNNAKH